MCKKNPGWREPNQNSIKHVEFDENDPFNAYFLGTFDYIWCNFVKN